MDFTRIIIENTVPEDLTAALYPGLDIPQERSKKHETLDEQYCPMNIYVH